MQFFSTLILIFSAAFTFAGRFPRHGEVTGEISPMVSERGPSTLAIVCGAAGTDKEKPAAYTGPHASSIQDCLSKCRASSGCQSVAFDLSHSICLLYKAPVTGNINYDSSQVYQFYDLSCPQGGSSGIASIITLTVTGAPLVATSTVVVVVSLAPTSVSRRPGLMSTLVVYYTVTQGALISSTNLFSTQTTTIYPPLSLTTVLLTNAPTSTAPASTTTPSGGLLCGVKGWSAATTSFF